MVSAHKTAASSHLPSDNTILTRWASLVLHSALERLRMSGKEWSRSTSRYEGTPEAGIIPTIGKPLTKHPCVVNGGVGPPNRASHGRDEGDVGAAGDQSVRLRVVELLYALHAHPHAHLLGPQNTGPKKSESFD